MLHEVLSLGQQARKLGLRQISISGGEPLCHPDIVGIVNGLARQNLNTSIYTTGLIFDENQTVLSYKNWDEFHSADPTLIFNIQSTTPNIHDQLVVRQGAFALTKRSILLAQQEGFQIEVHIVPN
ncbi:unnamed protein product, partial [marine sediment metagenome]